MVERETNTGECEHQSIALVSPSLNGEPTASWPEVREVCRRCGAAWFATGWACEAPEPSLGETCEGAASTIHPDALSAALWYGESGRAWVDMLSGRVEGSRLAGRRYVTAGGFTLPTVFVQRREGLGKDVAARPWLKCVLDTAGRRWHVQAYATRQDALGESRFAVAVVLSSGRIALAAAARRRIAGDPSLRS